MVPNKVKNSKLELCYKCGLGFVLETTENKSSQLAVRGIPKPWGIQSTSEA